MNTDCDWCGLCTTSDPYITFLGVLLEKPDETPEYFVLPAGEFMEKYAHYELFPERCLIACSEKCAKKSNYQIEQDDFDTHSDEEEYHDRVGDIFQDDSREDLYAENLQLKAHVYFLEKRLNQALENCTCQPNNKKVKH